MARERSLLVRPVSDRFEKFAGLLSPIELRMGSSLSSLPASGQRRHRVRRPTVASEGDNAAELRLGIDLLGLEDAITVCGLDDEDVRLTVFVRSTALGLGYLALDTTIDGLDADELKIDLGEATHGVAFADEVLLSGYSIHILLTLDRDIDRDVESLDPTRRHSILDEYVIEVGLPGDGGVSLDIRPLNSTVRSEHGLAKDCWIFVESRELALSEVEQLAGVLTVYVDETMLAKLKLAPQKPASRLAVGMVLEHIYSFLIFTASDEIQSEGLSFPDIRDSLMHVMCKSWSRKVKGGREAVNEDREAELIFEMLTHEPMKLVSLLQRGVALPTAFLNAFDQGSE